MDNVNLANQHVVGHNMLDLEQPKSVYSVLATYFNNAEKNGLYVKGYVDGESTFESFLQEFNTVCKTKFIVRTSWRKTASTLPRRTRYGREERVYWEYNSGNLEVPFTGVPFVVRSCLTKHCQYGSHYYKSTAERVSKQFMDAQNDPTIAPPEIKKRRNKPSKKRDCPAIMHIREIVMFPDFALDLERMFDTKYHVRQEKTNLILKLKQELAIHAKNNPSACTQAPLNGMQRFYVNIPLPEVHIGHPQPCGGIGPTIHPSVTAKIDDLLSHGIYDARHVRVIVHDYVREVVIMQDQNNMYQYNLVLFPTEHDIADYIYISSITVKPTIIVEDDTAFTSETGVKGEMEGSIQELMGLIQKCKDEETLQRAKSSMLKIIKTVKSSEDPPPKKKRKKKSTEEEDNDDDDLTEIIVFQNLEKDTNEQKEQASIEFNH